MEGRGGEIRFSQEYHKRQLHTADELRKVPKGLRVEVRADTAMQHLSSRVKMESGRKLFRIFSPPRNGAHRFAVPSLVQARRRWGSLPSSHPCDHGLCGPWHHADSPHSGLLTVTHTAQPSLRHAQPVRQHSHGLHARAGHPPKRTCLARPVSHPHSRCSRNARRHHPVSSARSASHHDVLRQKLNGK